MERDPSTSTSVAPAFDACLSNASELLRAAEIVLKENCSPNIAFHLAILAMEELGKSQLLSIDTLRELSGLELGSEKSMENHVKKLFWGLWGPLFSPDIPVSQEITELQDFARTLHDQRLSAMYVDPRLGALEEQTQIGSERAAQLIKLVALRLELI